MKARGFTLVELSVVLVVLLILATAAITGIMARKEQAYLEDAILRAKEALRVVERIRTWSDQSRYYFFDRDPVSVFNIQYRTALSEESLYGTKFYIQITKGGAGPVAQTYSAVDVMVKGKVSPLGVVAEPVGEDTHLIFYSEPEFGRNNFIIGPAQSEKAIWFLEETR